MTHKELYKILRRCLILSGGVLAMLITSCNAKENEIDDDNYLAAESVALSGFHLQADSRVMKNLDSVFFSIDLEHGVVFNADSLPKGTNIGKLVPVISYPSSVAKATIEMKGGSHREDGTVNYISNPSDTIDFTGEVTLTLSTANDVLSKTYRLKVNVHREEPDTLYWDKMGEMSLPSRMAAPAAQKSVEFNGGVLSVIEENDGSYTVAVTDDIFGGTWKKSQLAIDFTPDLTTLTSGGDVAYLRDADSNLYSSTDGSAWIKIADGWDGVIGMYGSSLLGYCKESGVRRMVSWPEGSIADVDLPADFPSGGFSRPIEFTNRWASSPTIVIIGGEPITSAKASPTWAFDGTQWTDIADNALPPLAGVSVVNYYSYLNNASSGLLREFNVLLAFGGVARNGDVNRTVYISYDYGINWMAAPAYIQLPDAVSIGGNADALTLGTSMQSNLSSRWKAGTPRRRLPYTVDGDIVKWECPYIFVFGGMDKNGTLNDKIRSAVLQRLTFTPLF